MKDDYSDIINMPFHEPDPVKHPRMSAQERAAQFAPFAALTGYSQIVEDTENSVFNDVMNETTFEDIDDI